MKTILTLLLAGFAINAGCYNQTSLNTDQYKVSDNGYSFVMNFKLSSPATLDISTTGGNIITSGQDKDAAEVTFIVKKRNKVLEMTLDDLKKLANVDITQTGASLKIKISGIKERGISVSLEIKTPLHSTCKLNTSGGNIALNNLNGTQVANTSGGNVNLMQLSGMVTAHTSGGNIAIRNSGASFDASTSGGNISMDSIGGKLKVATSGGNIHGNQLYSGLDAHTSGGDIGIKDSEGIIDVKTTGGSIFLEGLSGTITAKTTGGNVSAKIAKLSGELNLETTGGNVHATLPSGIGLNLDLSGDNIHTPLSNFTGSSGKNRINGQMNGGGTNVHIASSGGSISLDYD